jgi:hypothetical protein
MRLPKIMIMIMSMSRKIRRERSVAMQRFRE